MGMSNLGDTSPHMKEKTKQLIFRLGQSLQAIDLSRAIDNRAEEQLITSLCSSASFCRRRTYFKCVIHSPKNVKSDEVEIVIIYMRSSVAFVCKHVIEITSKLKP